jgi:rubrerythrin
MRVVREGDSNHKHEMRKIKIPKHTWVCNCGRIETDLPKNPPSWSAETQKELEELKANQDDFDTSDLQGVVMALAMKELHRTAPVHPLEISDLSDEMLEYIYEPIQNPRPMTLYKGDRYQMPNGVIFVVGEKIKDEFGVAVELIYEAKGQKIIVGLEKAKSFFGREKAVRISTTSSNPGEAKFPEDFEQAIRHSVNAENDAINLYEQLRDRFFTTKEQKNVIDHIIKEEKEHIVEFEELLQEPANQEAWDGSCAICGEESSEGICGRCEAEELKHNPDNRISDYPITKRSKQ